jgi:hypothetical protein
MPLKPGQTKELEVKIEKLKELVVLKNKLDNLNYDLKDVKNDRDFFVRSEYNKTIKKIKNEIENTKKEILKIKKFNAGKNNPALTKLIENIAKDCSQVIPFYRLTGKVLLRGVKGQKDAYIGRSWENRKPTNSFPQLQKLYDMVLQNKGFKALRSNSIFTTSSSVFAEKFGFAYIIFPKNGFEFHWNRYRQDLVLEIPEELLNFDYVIDVLDDANEWSLKKFNKRINTNRYKAVANIESFIKKLQDIGYPKADKFTPKDFINYEYIEEYIGPTKTNFKKGLLSGNEVLIHGEYYAIKLESDLGDYVLNALKINYQSDDEYEE